MIQLVKIIIGFILFFFTSFVTAQIDKNSELYKLLRNKDSVLFDAAFNQCDTEALSELFTEDFEFYHDKGGVTFGKDNFLDPMKENCSKREPGTLQPAKRILLANSLEVFPLFEDGKLYGAIQNGVHRFEFLDQDRNYQKGDVAKFTHVWIKENDQWRIKRELSFDHQPME